MAGHAIRVRHFAAGFAIEIGTCPRKARLLRPGCLILQSGGKPKLKLPADGTRSVHATLLQQLPPAQQ